MFAYNLYKAATSSSLKFQIKKMQENWQPLIRELTEMAEKVQNEYKLIAAEEKNEIKTEPSKFVQNVHEILAQINTLPKTVNYELHHAADPKAAEYFLNKNKDVIVIVQEKKQQYTYVKNTKEEIIKTKVSTAIELPISDKTSSSTKVMFTEKNIEKIDNIVSETLKGAHILQPDTDWNAIIKLIEKIPGLLAAFNELNLHSKLQDQLSELKQKVGSFDFQKIIEDTLSTTQYKKIVKEMGEWLDEENFNKLSRDQQAITLSFMELYNQALKQIYLQLSTAEQKMNLKPGALSNIAVKGKSLNKLSEEFNEVYKRSMKAAGYEISVELSPFTQSLTKKSSVSAPLQTDITTGQPTIEVKKIEDLYTFTEKMLHEQYQRLKKLKTDMAAHASQQESVAKSGITIQDMTDKSKEFLVIAERELKLRLDENIYATYFVSKPKPSLDKFDKKEQQGWLQDAGQAFIQLKNIMAQIEALQQPMPITSKAETPASRLANRAEQLNELTKAGIELLASLNQIKNDTYLRSLITIPDLTSPFTPLKRVSEESIFHKLQSSIKTSTASLAENMKVIQGILTEKLTGNNIALTKSTLNTFTAIGGLVDKLNNLAAAKEAIGVEVNLVSFAVQNFSQINAICTELPQVLALLSQLSKGEVTKAAEAINHTLEQFVLLSDKLEIQLGLKEGHLTHQLEPVIHAFNVKILELGYRFAEEKTYPYQTALAKQRDDLLSSQEISPIQKELIQQRMTKEKEPTSKEKKSLGQSAKNQFIIDEISKYIDSLRSHKQKDLEKTIELLESLIKEKNASSFDLTQSWKQLKADHPKHFVLLLKGSTGFLLKKLEYKDQEISQEDIFNSLQRELAALKKQRGSYFTQSARLLEEKITVWEHLQDLLKTHNLSDALDQLAPAQLAMLKKHDHGLLERIQTMNSALAVEARLTTLINSSPSKPDVLSSETEAKKEDIIHIIDKQINKLDSKNNNSKRKYVLLRELKEKLENNLSLDAAIKQMKSQHNDVHLLFQGRTGQMMKSIESITLTKDDLIKRIDHELDILLHKQHSSHFMFFAQRRTTTLESHIQSLEKLKTALTKSDNKTAREAIAALSKETVKILQLHEPALLKKIDADSPKNNSTSFKQNTM